MRGSTLRLLAFAAGLAIGAVVWLPLRSVLPSGLTAAGVEGTIWHGAVRGAEAGGLLLGDLSLALQPLSLMRGEMRLTVAGPTLAGQAIVGSGFENLDATIQPMDPALSAQRINLLGTTLRFAGSTCVAASGQVEITTAMAMLSGVPRCAGDAARVDLASADGLVTMRGWIDSSGRWTLEGA